MEGVGSRVGRASSRYGPATVFTGPVRRWKKQWVQVSSSPSSRSVHHRDTSRSNASDSNGDDASALLLCRWTPISPTLTGDPDKNSEQEPPRRKFRYTPVVVLEEKKKEAAEKVDNESKTSETDKLMLKTVFKGGEISEKPNTANTFLEEDQVSNEDPLTSQHADKSHLDLSLCLKGTDDDHDSDSESRETQLGRVSSGGLWDLH